MICPSCEAENLAGTDRCEACGTDLSQDDGPELESPARWRVVVDPISGLDPSTIAPQVVASGTSLAAAVRQMQERNIGYLLVIGPDARLIGIITEHDLLCRVAGLVTDLESVTVDEFMDHSPTVLRADQPIAHALHTMSVLDFMYIPIVDAAGCPTDLLSFRRVARLIEQME